jgi:hypothetical protein
MAIERLKKGPSDYFRILQEYSKKGIKYTDTDFMGKEMLYWESFAKEYGFKREKFDNLL